jgi:gamma-glutamylcyclotransferase
MADLVIWYFAYGSNMNVLRLAEARLRPRGITLSERVCGRLDGWRLAFNKAARKPLGSGAGNIVAAPGQSVFGTLNAMAPEGLSVLDEWEGVAGGHYKRLTVPAVRTDSGETVDAVTYVALKEGEGLRPTRAYLAHLLAGRDLLPADYCRLLEATPTFD